MNKASIARFFVNKFKEWHDNPLVGYSVKMTSKLDGTLNLFEWTCSMPGPETSPYEGGVLRFHVLLPQKDYEPFYINFVPALFHPNVDDDGELKNSFGHMWPSLTVREIMMNICLVLIAPCPFNTYNKCADKLYKENLKEYQRVAKERMEIHQAKFLQFNAAENPN